MASSEAATIPSVEEVTSEERAIYPTVEEALSPTPADPKYNGTEGTTLSDEDNENNFDDEDEKPEELSPINQDPEPNISFEDSGFTEFPEEGEDKDDVDDDEDEED